MDRDYIRRLRDELSGFGQALQFMGDRLVGQRAQDEALATSNACSHMVKQLGRFMMVLGEQETGTRIKPEELYSSAEVASYLKVTKKTLERWRSVGQGPAFRRVGLSIYYKGSDIIEAVEGAR